MDLDKRIEQLEAQVQGLTQLVRQLIADKPADAPAAPPEVTVPPPPSQTRPLLHRLEAAIRGDAEEDIEAHIGAVWLSRLAVVILMTFIALFARETYLTEHFGPIQKVLLGYGIAAAFIGYGVSVRKRQDLFAQAILGCGLAVLYFVTYAAFFVPQVQVVQNMRWTGLGVLTVCLAIIAGVAHWRRSQTVAGISLFLAYYTVVVSCTQDPSLESYTHAFVTCSLLAVVTLVFHYVHRWLLFTWAALIATQLTYLLFFLRKPPELEVSDHTYFWISNGFLALCYLLFSLACIVDARKKGEYRKTVAPMAGVNSFVFFTLTWFSIREHYLEEEWMFRLGFAATLLVFALLTEISGPKRNYLFQIFIAKTVIMLTLALQSYYSGEKLVVAFAIECLGLGFSYKRSGLIIFKALGLSLMFLTVGAALFNIQASQEVRLLHWLVPANWFSIVGVAFFFSLVAWFYEHFARKLRPEERIIKGQWFLADTALDWTGAGMAMAHAGAAALLLLVLTILEYSEDPRLPFLLAAEGALMAAAGLLLRTPQIEIACLLLLSAAHVCFYVFLWMPVPAFVDQPRFVLYTSALALLTYAGAYAWERYLRRFRNPERDLEHHVVAALPYLIATLMIAVLIGRKLDPLYVPAANGVLAMTLFLTGMLTRFPAIKASGIFATGLATVTFYTALYNVEGSIAKHPQFLIYAGLFLTTCVFSERLIAMLQRRELIAAQAESLIRTALVALAILLGILGLFESVPRGQFIFYLLGYSVIAIALGAVFRESRYRWAALFLIGAVIVWAFLQFRESSPLIFGATALVLLVVSWAYSRTGRKASVKPAAPPEEPAGARRADG